MLAIWQVNEADIGPARLGTPFNTNGGSFDWEYGDTTLHAKMFSLSTEVGNFSDYFWPSPSRIVPLCARTCPANLFCALCGCHSPK